jgi:hypothetical protein
MARVAHRSGMKMVTWDVSVGASGVNPDVLARRLQRIRPGSIVSIRVHEAHGGVFPDERADAVPALLDGLRMRHLEPVGLDELLRLPAYAGRC